MATAHGASDEEVQHWASLAGSGLTLALYMGKQIAASTAIKLVLQGVSARMPVGIVVNAGRSDRSLYRGTLGELADGVHDFADGPAIIFVGEAVAYGDWQEAIALAAERLKVA